MAYRFEGFVFDRARGLFAAGQPVALEPQVFELLSYLLDHRDRVVTKDELNAAIWGGRIVSEAALSTRIRAVRRALGDDRGQQKYIRTHPKRGFRFVAPVEAVDDGATAGPKPPRPRSPRLRRMVPGLVALAALIIAGAVGFWWADPRPPVAVPKLSIAVLPFDNLSADPAQGYFADAFTEDLITDLSRIRDAFVIARRTSFTYRARDVDVPTVADELGVRYVLEGSVQRADGRVRINAQLIDGATGGHVWSQRYDRDVADAFTVQSAVTGQIASALKAELRDADLERQGPPESRKAWDYALRGNVLLVRPQRDFRRAKALLEKAIELDPTIASAWSGLAFVHFAASSSQIPGVTEPNSKTRSLEAAQRAVELDPKNAEGHWMVGVGYARNGETARAWAACETAMSLNPNNDCAYVCAGLTRMAQGRPADAVPYFQHSLRLNPRFRTFTKYKYMGLAYVHDGRDAEAIDVFNRAISQAPEDALAHLGLASALALSGEIGEAEATLAKVRALTGEAAPTIAGLNGKLSWLGPGTSRLLDGLSRAGLAPS